MKPLHALLAGLLAMAAAPGPIAQTGGAASAVVATPGDVALAIDTELRAEPFADAAVLRRLAAGTRVALLRTQAGWAEVRIDGRAGWVRAGALGGAGAAVAPAARLDTGRASIGNVALVAGIRTVPRAGRHALIVAIGDHASTAIPTLGGVEHDAEAARTFALAMGVPEANVRTLRDHEALAERVRDELAAIADRTGPGARVLVHVSAQGTQVAQADGRCGDGWLAADGRPIGPAQFAEWLGPIAARADKLLVVVDAGRGAPPAGTPRRTGLAPRYVEPVGSPCAPGAPAAPELDALLTGAGMPAANVALVRGAQSGEPAWEDPETGGWATAALVACATRDARDLDGSGAISLAEIAACAQRGVDARAAARRLPGSRVTIGGNARLVPVIAAAATPAATPATGGTPGVAASLADLLAQRDGGWPLAWRPASGDAAPSLTSARDGFLSLILVGSPGGLAQPLWPLAGGAPVRVSAGVPTTIDDPALRARLRDPGQASQVLAVVTARQRTPPEGTAAIGWLVEDDGFAATTVVAP